MELTVSIVNWNVKEYLRQCLESIFKYSHGIELEIIVVDNASSDGSVDMLREEFPQVKIIENTENLGYGCGHNQVIPIAKGKYILFLNPDTEMLPHTLRRVIKFMDMHPAAGACECREVLSKDKEAVREEMDLSKFTRLLWSFSKFVYRIFPNALTAHLYADFIVKAVKSSYNRYKFSEKPFIESGFLLVRKLALEHTGGFNPKFFYGDEGMELTYRIKKRGWKLYVVQNAKIIHYYGRSVKQMNEAELEEFERNWERRKNFVY